MDEQEALLARRVARAASAWMRSPATPDLYRRLVDAVTRYDAHIAPALPLENGSETDGEEVLDALADARPPQPLGSGLAGLEETLRAAARREL